MTAANIQPASAPAATAVPAGATLADRLSALRQRGPSRPVALLLLALILIWSAAWRVSFMQGFAASDDQVYYHCATQWNAGQSFQTPEKRVDDHRGARMSFILATAGWLRLFGHSERALCMLDVVAGTLGIAALYWVAALIAGRWAALCASLLASVYPPDLLMNGWLFPDHFATLGVLVSMGAFLSALKSRTRAKWLWMVLGGITLGAAVSAKEPSVLLVGILPLLGLCACRGRRMGIGLAIAAIGLLVFSLEFPLLRATTGDWLFRFHATANSFAPRGIAYRDWRWQMAFFYPYALMARQDTVGLFGWLVLAGLAWAAAWRRRYALVLAWTVATWLFLEYAPGSLEPYRPIPKELRFLSALTLLLFIPLGELMALLLSTPGAVRWPARLAFCGLIAHGVLTANQFAQPLYWASQPRAVRAALALQQRGECPNLILPKEVTYDLYPPDLPKYAEIERISLSDRGGEVQPIVQELFWPARGKGLVIPSAYFTIMTTGRRHHIARAAEYQQYLDAHARRIPLHDPPPAVDRWLAHLGVPPLTTPRVIGHIYVLPTFP